MYDFCLSQQRPPNADRSYSQNEFFRSNSEALASEKWFNVEQPNVIVCLHTFIAFEQFTLNIQICFLSIQEVFHVRVSWWPEVKWPHYDLNFNNNNRSVRVKLVVVFSNSVTFPRRNRIYKFHPKSKQEIIANGRLYSFEMWSQWAAAGNHLVASWFCMLNFVPWDI